MKPDFQPEIEKCMHEITDFLLKRRARWEEAKDSPKSDWYSGFGLLSMPR